MRVPKTQLIGIRNFEPGCCAIWPHVPIPFLYNESVAKVKVLPEVLAHQIAAGEIVERPASVVKELLENAIDAEADNILVELTDGGKSRIRVKDNGCGMSGEDAELAFEHHATSKIFSIEDLQEITTLGFRGEALPSIASVSRLRVRTASREDSAESSNPLGSELVYEGGFCSSKTDIAWPAGTEIVVEDLFFNIPVRKKFLKTKATELSHISRYVTSYALVSPGITFRLEHEGRRILDTPAVKTLQERIFQIFGEKIQANLVDMNYERNGIHVAGVTSLPHEQKNNANSMYLFVNGRLVRDKVLTHAIRFSYQGQMPHSAYPFTVLFLQMPPREIDVNVHPAKVELRFHDSRKVHSAIYHAIEEALLLRKTAPDLGSIAKGINFSGIDEHPGPNGHSSHGEGFPSAANRFPFGGNQGRMDYFHPNPDSYIERAFPPRQIPEKFPGKSPPDQAPFPDADQPWTGREESRPSSEDQPTRHRILGQFKESFIVAADSEGLMLIDQHVAHERVLYEQALKALSAKEGMASQSLLFPETVALTPEQGAMADQFMEHLNRNGYDIDWFGSGTIVVRAIPVLAKGADIRNLIDDLLQDSSGLFDDISVRDSSEKITRLREKMAISLSCRAAVKVNTVLSHEKMEWLVDSLFQCRNPYTCPHGRPIVLKLETEEILKGFKRI